MTKTRSTKSALISSVLALLLCFTMLLGTTFAWFTDSVTSANNIIQSGNLDIALDYWDGEDNEWKTVEGTNSLFSNNLWEPGHTEVVYLKLSNLGSLALKYQLAISVLSETEGTNMAGDPFKLSDYIQMGVVEGVNGETGAYADRATAVDAVKDASGIIGAGYTKSGEMLADADELYMAVVVYMPETVGNEANAKTGTDAPIINLGVQVLATQMTAEGDSFDTDYDKDAWMPGMLVYDAADLKAALANGGNVTLAANVALTEIVEIAEGTTVALNLNGKTIKGSVDRTVSNGLIINNGSLTIYGENSVIDNSVAYGGSVILNTGDLVLNGGTYIGGVSVPADGKYASYAINVNNGGTLTVNNANISGRGAIGVTNDATLVINDGLYEATTEGDSAHVIYVSENGTAIINGGTFNHARTNAVSNGDVLVYVNKADTSSAVINGGTFDAVKAAISYSTHNVTIKGGTFKNAAATVYGGTLGDLIADGYTTVKNVDGFDAVIPAVEGVTLTATDHAGVYMGEAKTYYVFDKTGLMNLNALFAEIGANEANINNVNLMADVDLTGEDWEPLTSMWINFDGNSHTISNLTASDMDSATGRRGGFWGYAGAVSINNLTLENVTVNGSQAGTFAGSAEGLKMNNCFLKGTNVVNYVPGVEDWCGIGAITGVTQNSTINAEIVAGATVTLNRGEMITAAGCTHVDDLTGHIQANNGNVENNGTVTATGKIFYMVADATRLSEILSSDATEINVVLADGEYTNVLTASNKTINIKGGKGAVIAITDNGGNHAHMSLQNCDVTIEGVTCTFAGNYPAYINDPDLTYIDCTLKGQFYLYGDTEFIGCTFENGDEAAKTGFNYVYTYGNTDHINVLVEKCTFNTQGHGLIMFSDNGGAGKVTMTVRDCTFHGGAGRTAWAVANQNTAAIEIDGSCGANYTLNLEGNNTFDGGFSGLWRIKAMTENVTTTVNGIEYTGTSTDVYLDGVHYTKDADRNVTIVAD